MASFACVSVRPVSVGIVVGCGPFETMIVTTEPLVGDVPIAGFVPETIMAATV